MNKEKDEVKDKVWKVSLLPEYVEGAVKCLNCGEIVLVKTLERMKGRCPHCNQELILVGVAE